MSNKIVLTAAAAVVISAASFAASTGGALAAAPAPHYKPLICIFLPSICRDWAMATPVHKTAMKPVHRRKHHKRKPVHSATSTNKPMVNKPMIVPKKY